MSCDPHHAGESAVQELPADLLAAIAAPGGGRVVLVLGAGCSHEQPPGLPLAGELAFECHRRLVADQILQEGDVGNPHDLSAVAEAVVAKTSSQRELVERFPPDDFRNAEPNEGYMIAAAMLLEGALGTAMTLNFDLALTTALARLGAGAAVSTIRGPEDHHRLGGRNLIYLHRNIDSDADELILRAEALERAWRNRWEEVVARRVLGGPVTVFVGLGSPAGVLVETTRKILEALARVQATVLVVDPLDRAHSDFFAEVKLEPELYIQLGWGDFMHRLALRLIEEHRAAIESECKVLIRDLALEGEDVSDLSQRLVQLGLLGLGRLRACWLLQDRSYVPHEGAPLRLLSDVLVAIGMIERISGMRARFETEGTVGFAGQGRSTEVFFCSGGGWMTWAALEARVSFRRQQLGRRGRMPSTVVVAGVTGSPAEVKTPGDIAGEFRSTDVAVGTGQSRIITVTELRDQPERIREVVG